MLEAGRCRKPLLVLLLALTAVVGATSGCRSADDAVELASPAGTSRPADASPGTVATPSGTRPGSGPAGSGASANAGAGAGGPGNSASVTTASVPVTSTTVSRPPATETGAASLARCAVLGALPAGAARVRTLSADLDGDGAADTVTSYAVGTRPGAGDWHLRVSFAAGGGSDTAVAEDPAPGEVRVLGAVVLGAGSEPGGETARPVLFVLTGSGASARTVGLYRVDGCDLLPMVDRAGRQASFLVGASVGHQEGLRCENAGDGSTLVEVQSAPNPASGYDVTRRTYTRDGNQLVVLGNGVTRTEPDAPAESGRIVDCGAVDLAG